MEAGLVYLLIFGSILIIIIYGSINYKFHFIKFSLSIAGIFFIPGLTVALGQNLLLFFSEQVLWIPALTGIAAGIILHEIIFKRIEGFSTFEHELSHALVALFFFRKIKKFKVTRYNGGYVEYTNGFGGEAGNHFITLAPYFLPTFTLVSVFIRPFLPASWFPLFDVWIGITFSYQTLNNIKELQRNWTHARFHPAGRKELTKSDIGIEGYIFSLIMIFALKLLFLSLLMSIIVNGYTAFPHLCKTIWQQSLQFFHPPVAEINAFLRSI